MGLFSHTRTFEEPVLGKWNRRDGLWWAAYELPGHVEAIEVGAAGSRSAPDPEALRLAIELQEYYEGLIESIQAALYEHYEPYREAFERGELPVEDVPLIVAACELWPHVTLEGVRVEPLDGVLTVQVTYETAWDYDHPVAVRFQDWELVELCAGA